MDLLGGDELYIYTRIGGMKPSRKYPKGASSTNTRELSSSKDLRRHKISRDRKLGERGNSRCPYPDCKYAVIWFPRKDNYQRHIRNQHESRDSFQPE